MNTVGCSIALAVVQAYPNHVGRGTRWFSPDVGGGTGARVWARYTRPFPPHSFLKCQAAPAFRTVGERPTVRVGPRVGCLSFRETRGLRRPAAVWSQVRRVETNLNIIIIVVFTEDNSFYLGNMELLKKSFYFRVSSSCPISLNLLILHIATAYFK